MTSLAEHYDALAETYAGGRHLFDTRPLLLKFAEPLSSSARVLDVGCGAGEPVARFFIDRGDQVLGIDCSPKMIELARGKVPEAEFAVADMLAFDAPAGQFDAITAVYSVFHINRSHHQALFAQFARWLKPGGHLLLTLASEAYSGEPEFDGQINFIGHDLPYSHDRPEQALAKLEAAGLSAWSAEHIETGGESFFWVMAQRQATDADS